MDIPGARAEAADDGLGAGALGGERPAASVWMGWRRRALVAWALLGCLAVLALARTLAASPALSGLWQAREDGQLVLLAGSPEWNVPAGRPLVALRWAGGEQPVDALLLHRSPRWQPDDAARRSQVLQHRALALALASGELTLVFADERRVSLPAAPRGLDGIGWLFWPLAAMALLLALLGAAVVLAKPRRASALFALMALAQAANLLIIATESTKGLALPAWLPPWDAGLRLALDALTGAAAVHSLALALGPGAAAGRLVVAAWAVAIVGMVLLVTGGLQPMWWWGQGLCAVLGALALAVLHRARRRQPSPYARVLQRLCAVALGTLALVTVAVAASAALPVVAHGVAVGAAASWYLFLASLLLLMPFLSRSRQLLREFALLAGITTVAASIDLLFVAVFSLSPFTSLTVAVFVALALYALARQRILDHLLGTGLVTTERTFELLVRAAREAQAHPDRYVQVLGQLLRDLFEPLELQPVARVPAHARVLGGGVALLVPLRPADDDRTAVVALLLRHAQRGQRLFGSDDARLADRMVEQLRRAVVFDQAVERGRHEERLRIAQDLHDDIGARLLTLMYQARTPEMEDYIRHTLQDLKTLTRGLAAAEHRFSHAAAEWKSDIGHRLGVAQVQLDWSCSVDNDLPLSVVEWSGLTRILRELVTNALFHGRAGRIEVRLQLQAGQLLLSVSDDGVGSQPDAWSHGLGMGGVRKRVKALDGQVRWFERPGGGISCEVRVPALGGQR